jgi:hypothetical protein
MLRPPASFSYGTIMSFFSRDKVKVHELSVWEAEATLPKLLGFSHGEIKLLSSSKEEAVTENSSFQHNSCTVRRTLEGKRNYTQLKSYKVMVVPTVLCWWDYKTNKDVRKKINIQGDYKWCELLHKFIGKKVIVTQKLNAHHCREQLKKFFDTLCKFHVPFVALHTSRRYSTSYQTFCNKGWSIFAIDWRILSELSSEFSLNSYHRFRWMKLQHTKRFFPVESPSYVCAVL